MTQQPIIVVGGGGHAKVVVSIILDLPQWHCIGYTDKEDRGLLLGVPYFGDDGELPHIKERSAQCAAVIGIGTLGETTHVEQLYERLRILGFGLPTIIAPSAVIAQDVEIGEGTVIMPVVAINTGTRIGRCAIINTHASLDHDCRIGDFVHIAPGVACSGGVTVGDRTLVGIGASVKQGITIGTRCIIGAGAAAVNNCLEQGTYVGVPARMKTPQD